MEEKGKFDELKKQLKIYIEDRVELYRLDAIDHTSYLLSFIIGVVVVIAVLMLFLISFGFFLGLLLGELMESNWMGFGLVSILYLLLLLILYARFKFILRLPLQNLLIKKIDKYYEEKGD